MKLCAGVILAIASILAGMPGVGGCADASSQAQAAPAAHLTNGQLDQMLAPIALYPDALLAQILMASTYPLEIVEADRWVQDAHNAALTGNDLDAALQSEPWDPSVKSLVPFPQVLHMMDSNLGWTEQLGDAFLSDRNAVMDSVQRLRKQAEASGNLHTSSYQTVKTQGQAVVIEPVGPEIVYVPVYDPFIVYGVWLYPEFPPFYFPGFFDVVVAVRPGFGWCRFVIVGPLWGWGRWDWGRQNVFINHNRFNELNTGAPRIDSDTWRHSLYHRRGVPYRDERVRVRYQGGSDATDTRRFRGYPPPTPPNTVPGVVYAPRMGEARGQEPRPPRAEGRQQEGRQQEEGRQRERTQPHNTREASPPAYESFGRGADVRNESRRGYDSRQSAPQSVPRATNPGAGTRVVPKGDGRRFENSGGRSGR
jgi:hypothetical protein